MTKILVVDDDTSILDAVALILETVGYTVVTTPKGQDTYDKVSSFQPDLIILDVLMSGSDGREICKHLKKDPAAKDIPILMVSAQPSAKQSVVECGANDFLPKPFETSTLLEKIEKWVG